MEDIPVSFYRDEDPPKDELPETFIDRYSQWAESVTDAPPQYHVVNAAVILSTVMTPYLVLETSFGEIRPNIWSMILAGTTSTRKSTTMDMAKKMLDECHPDYLMGTDGSPEGIITELAHRGDKVSMFHRDEITGWIETTSKEYMQGMLASLTRIYDGKSEKRLLRKEAIDLIRPNLVIMSGGIRTKMQELVTMEHIRSGFLPRFIIVTGTTPIADQRPIGPPEHTNNGNNPRDEIVAELYKIVNYYEAENFLPTEIQVGEIIKMTEGPAKIRKLTANKGAWERIRKLKWDAGYMGENSDSPEIFLPVYDRLSNSIIKVAMLIAGSEQREVITELDVITAISYSDQWIYSATNFAHALEAAPDIDKWEKKADKILEWMKTLHPKGATKSELMRRWRIKAKDFDDLAATMVHREYVKVVKIPNMSGHGRSYRTEFRLAMNYVEPEEDHVVVAEPGFPNKYIKNRRTNEYYRAPKETPNRRM